MSATSVLQGGTSLRLARTRAILLLGLLASVGLLLMAMMSSIAFGAADIAPADVWAALFNFDPTSTDHLVIRTLRVPRAVVAALVGASLAVAGAIMQGLTRNPLGDPGILGINTGPRWGLSVRSFFSTLARFHSMRSLPLLGLCRPRWPSMGLVRWGGVARRRSI